VALRQWTRARWWTLAVLLTAPFLGVLFLRAPVINQIQYIDPWFYSGYGWSLTHGLRVFENLYYGVRFPPNLLIGGAADLFGAVAGYLVLRYLILVAAGVALYRCATQFTSQCAATAAVLLLALDVFYLRLVLWDYVTFVQIPAMLVAVAIWPRCSRSWGLVPAAGAGVLICAATVSTELSFLIVPPVLVVELVAVLRRGDGELVRLVARVGAALLGAVVIFLIGWLAYWLMVGFSPDDMIRPTLDFLRNGTTASFVEPARKWIFNEPKIYAPVVLVAGMILIARRRLLGTDVVARLGQFSVVFIAELWVYRFVATDSVIETWWAYGVTAVPMAFAGAIILAELDRLPRRSTLAIIGAVVAAALTDLIIRVLGVHAVELYDKLRGHYWRELVVVLVGLVGLMAWPRLRPEARGVAVITLLVVVTGLSLTPAVYFGVGQTGEFSHAAGEEVRAYAVSHTVVQAVDAQDTLASRTLVWFPNDTDLLASTWALFPSIGGSLEYYLTSTPLTQLTPFEKQRLGYPTTARVLVLSQAAGGLAQARATLRREGYKFRAQPVGVWGGGRLHHQLLQLRKLPPGGSRQAVRLAVSAILSAWRDHNGQRLCWIIHPAIAQALATHGRTCATGMRRALRGTATPSGPIRSISISEDVAHVVLAGSARQLVLDHAQGEWLLVSGGPWAP
jgi:hypothetical protein